jgi:broad specificity phosphatase PhoE
MPLLLLIRHGENDYTKKHRFAGHLPGVHLNKRGQEQAHELGEAFQDFSISAIYSSPLERALETAAPIAAACGLDVHTVPGLIETNIGRWQGRSRNSLSAIKAWKIVQAAPSRFHFPGGESFHECQGRVVTALDTILRGHGSKDIIACIFHADPIKLAVAYYLGMPLDNFQRLVCETGTVTVLHIHDTGAILLKLNQHPPLDFLHQMKKVQDDGRSGRK